jgi:hypothetical protein
MLRSCDGNKDNVEQSAQDLEKNICNIVNSMRISVNASTSHVNAPHNIFYIHPSQKLVVTEKWISGYDVYVPTDHLLDEVFHVVLKVESQN